jgi:membrane protease YdiL (CAAX protease family)
MNFFRSRPALAYFLLTFVISWICAFAVAAPHLFRHESLPRLTGILMFPAMLLGPCVSSFAMTFFLDGKTGIRDLFARMTRWRLSLPWYVLLFLPPTLVLLVLYSLRAFISQVYAPNRFFIGILFGIPAGILEEIGWTGFAFPKLVLHRSALSSSLILGVLWSLWHLPVINFLGTITPHGPYWLPFFLAFAFAMTAMRVIICWAYTHTQSILLAQLLHISSTASLVIFSPTNVSGAQEPFWYSLYGTALWCLIVFPIIQSEGKNLRSNIAT